MIKKVKVTFKRKGHSSIKADIPIPILKKMNQGTAYGGIAKRDNKRVQMGRKWVMNKRGARVKQYYWSPLKDKKALDKLKKY